MHTGKRLQRLFIALTTLFVLSAPVSRPVMAQVEQAEQAEQAPSVQVHSNTPSIVVLMYHRFGDSRFPSTNTTREQLADHINIIKAGKRQPLLLAQIVDHLNNGTPLPDRAVAVTVDDAYKTFLTTGWPVLKAAGIPVILFVSPQQIDQGFSDLLTWDEIRQLIREGVSIGHHSLDHRHMPDFDTTDNRASLLAANERFREELGFVPMIFSYPYGEFGDKEMDLVKSMGFDAAFGQHSGAFDRTSHDRFALPRFALNEHYGSEDRVALALKTAPLPLRNLSMPDRTLSADTNPPTLGFTLDRGVTSAAVNCYYSGESEMIVEKPTESTINIRFDKPFGKGRSRVNCTSLSRDGETWYWFGVQFYVPGNAS